MTDPTDRGIRALPSNPPDRDGIEFIEYATSRRQTLGQVLAMMGFLAIVRHRSRAARRYRQGAMNIVVNAHADAPARLSPGGRVR